MTMHSSTELNEATSSSPIITGSVLKRKSRSKKTYKKERSKHSLKSLYDEDEASTAVPLALVSFFSSAFLAAAICHAGMLAFPPPEPNLLMLVGVPLREPSAGVEAAGSACVCGVLPRVWPLVVGAEAASVVVLDKVPFV